MSNKSAIIEMIVSYQEKLINEFDKKYPTPEKKEPSSDKRLLEITRIIYGGDFGCRAESVISLVEAILDKKLPRPELTFETYGLIEGSLIKYTFEDQDPVLAIFRNFDNGTVNILDIKEAERLAIGHEEIGVAQEVELIRCSSTLRAHLSLLCRSDLIYTFYKLSEYTDILEL